MLETVIYLRNKILAFIYRATLKPFFFRIDPEKIHDAMIRVGRILGANYILRKFIFCLFNYSNKKLEQDILGIHFLSPIGLAGGFDKNAELTDLIPSVGFGFNEVGSITGEPCEGNPKPRLWRLPKSKGLVVYYGLKNRGCEAMAQKLRFKKFLIPLGTNIAETNSKKIIEIEQGIADYTKTFREFSDIGSYFTINISCPSVTGGSPFLEADNLHNLLTEIDKIPTTKPLFLKLSPDLSCQQADSIIKIASLHRIHGFICGNLTKNRKNSKIKEKCPAVGGISGKPVEDLTNNLIKYIYQKTQGKYIIIGCGGVFSAEDAYKKIQLGASLVQLITGMIFEGPQLISSINQGLVSLLEKDGFANINEAVGVDVG